MVPESIFSKSVSYTEAERLIMQFISAKPAEFLVMSIQQVSARLQISDATVSRFARHAGYGDFKELKTAVASLTLGPAEKIQASIERGDGSAGSFLEAQLENIRSTIEMLDEGEFCRAADAIARSRRVLLLGKGAAAALVELLRFRLARFGKDVRVLAPGSDVMEGLIHANDETALVAFGFGRVPAEVGIALEHARNVGATSIMLTGRHLMGDATPRDVELVVYRGEPRDYHSMTSAVAVLDALVVAVASRMDGEALECLERIRTLKRANEGRLPR